MKERVTLHEALHRVECGLLRCERQRENQQRVLQLLTAIVETLENTKIHFLEKCPVAAVPADALSPSPDDDDDDDCRYLSQDTLVRDALGAVLHTLARSQHSVSAALARLSLRTRAVDERVQRLSAAIECRAAAVRERMEEQEHQGMLDATALAVLATVVRLGCGDASDTPTSTAEGSPQADVAGVSLPSCCAALRLLWRKAEQTTTAAIRDTADVQHSAVEATCRLLRVTLHEALLSHRHFPTPRVWQQQRDCRFAWREELHRADARRRAKWERHSRMADAVAKGELL